MSIVKSDFTKKIYDTKDVVRILNMNQAAAYMKYGIPLLDLWISKRNGLPTLVFIFNRDESKEAYDLWCDHKLVFNDEEESYGEHR